MAFSRKIHTSPKTKKEQNTSLFTASFPPYFHLSLKDVSKHTWCYKQSRNSTYQMIARLILNLLVPLISAPHIPAQTPQSKKCIDFRNKFY